MPSSSKVLTGVITALLVVIGLLTWQWLSERDDRVASQAAAEEATKMLSQWSSDLDAMQSAIIKLDSTMAEAERQLKVVRDSLNRERSRVEQRTRQAVSTLRDQLTGQQQVLLDSVTHGYDRQIELLNADLVQVGKLYALSQESMAKKDSALTSERLWRQEALGTMIEIRAAQKESFLSKASKVGVVVLAVVAAF